MKALRILNDKYKTLVQSYLSIDEQDMNENIYAEGFYNVLKNDEYHSAQISIREFILNNYFRIRAITNLMKLNSQHNFVQHLMIVYKTKYRLRVMNFDISKLK